MFFIEFERKRLFNLLERNKTRLNQRIIEMEAKLRGEAITPDEKRNADNIARVKDCESTKLWITVSSLKNGVESLKVQITSLDEHSRDISRTVFRPQSDAANPYAEQLQTSELIEGRLKELLVEFDSKIRNCDSILGGMAMATQMVSSNETARGSIERANSRQFTGMELLCKTRYQSKHHHCQCDQEG